MTDCRHIVSRGRPDAPGDWCVDCGMKVLDVETRPCGDCRHHDRVDGTFGGRSMCRHHTMTVTPALLVCYQVAKGSCWTAL